MSFSRLTFRRHAHMSHSTYTHTHTVCMYASTHMIRPSRKRSTTHRAQQQRNPILTCCAAHHPQLSTNHRSWMALEGGAAKGETPSPKNLSHILYRKTCTEKLVRDVRITEKLVPKNLSLARSTNTTAPTATEEKGRTW